MEKSCHNTYYNISRVAQQEEKKTCRRERLECRDKIAGTKKGCGKRGEEKLNAAAP